MELGLIGLGKMGGNMTARLLKGGHRVVVYDLSPEAVRAAEETGAEGASSLAALASKLNTPRVAWIMVPAGEPTEQTILWLVDVLEPGDIVIDGGNAFYKNSIRRAEALKDQGLHFVDVGVSSGVWGLTEGYGMMIGGRAEAVRQIQPIFETLAPTPERGWGHVGPSGAGHFVKMVHNGIEYGMMQAYAEGFSLLAAKETFDLDLHQVAEIWRFGTVIRSWLLDLTARALAKDQELADIAPWVADSGEGRWTVQEAVDLAVPAPVITEALIARFRSRLPENFSDRLLAALRHEFGGHAVKKDE
jgi:6-phosphogluconate dehydrogenase